MGNILDYLDWRGDLTFEQSPFNEVDNLILACFSYLDLDERVEVKNGNTLSVEELFAAFSRREMKKDLKAESAFLQNTPVLLEKMACAERFRKCTVGGFVNEILSSQAQQFAAVTIGLDDGTTYISFRGTDDTIVGWKEDFNLSNGVVPSHRKALEYLETHGTYIQSMLRIGGHSKGGNLAVYAGIHAEENVRGQIERIYSHDGPGMNEQIIAYSYYQEMAGRIRKTIPGFSVIGTLLGQQEISKVIKSDGVGILQHNPFNWVVEKGEFVPLPGLNKTAELLDQKIDNWVSGMTTEEREEFVNKLFSVISEAENLNGIGENWRDEFGRIAKKLLIP